MQPHENKQIPLVREFCKHKSESEIQEVEENFRSFLELISVTNFNGQMLTEPHQRKGQSFLYYSATVQLVHKRDLHQCTKMTITKEMG